MECFCGSRPAQMRLSVVSVPFLTCEGDPTTMSTPGLPTIWELVADGARALPEPFSRAALINWVRARRPDVGVPSVAAHIQSATDNAAHTGANPFAGRTPLLHRVGRGPYARYRSQTGEQPAPHGASRVVL